MGDKFDVYHMSDLHQASLDGHPHGAGEDDGEVDGPQPAHHGGLAGVVLDHGVAHHGRLELAQVGLVVRGHPRQEAAGGLGEAGLMVGIEWSSYKSARHDNKFDFFLN